MKLSYPFDDREMVCLSCNGTGRVVQEYKCPQCFGMGGTLGKGPSPLGSISMKCYACHGDGFITEEVKCLTCSGSGRVR